MASVSAVGSGASPAANLLWWPIVGHSQPGYLQAVWPGFPTTLPYAVTVSRPPYTGNEYADMVVPSRVTPWCNDWVVEKQKEKRIFFLDISVFDLVDAHKFLSLTDPKLLGWYLSLCPEDRQIIQDKGGFNKFLQRHPALELSKYHIHVKHFEINPSNVKKPLTMLDCSTRNEAQNHPYGDNCRTRHQGCHQGFQTASSSPGMLEPTHQKAHTVAPLPQLGGSRQQRPSSSAAVCKDPAALARFSLDMDLERHGRGGQPELSSQSATAHCHSANYTDTEVSSSQSEWESIEKDLSQDYFSFHNDRGDSECSISQTAELKQVSSLKENSTKDDGEDPGDSFHSTTEDDKGDDVKTPAASDCEAPAACSDTLKYESVIKRKTAEKSTSPVPCAAAREAGVGTEPAPCVSSATQTEDPQTADKHLNTEVQMADLDYLTEKFIKLQLAQEEQREQKEKRKSSGCRCRKECACVQRAQQAELSLLALQYSMCRRHCWRLYCTSTEAGPLQPLINNLPANMGRVLQKLDSDFNQMRDQIVAGVPLEKLEPLCVDCETVTSGERYTPAQMIGDVLGNVPSRVQETQRRTSGEHRGPDDPSEHNQRKEKQMKTEDSKVQRAVTLVPQDRDAPHSAHNPEDEQKTVCRKLSTCDFWYDAEEDLQPAAVTAGETSSESPSELRSSVLCVSNLPANVTEGDVMLWFEKYQPSEVSISTLKNDQSVAIVTVSGAQSAEAAASELNGCTVQGRTLHVEHINRAAAGSQSRGPESPQDTDRPQTSRTEASSSQRKQLVAPPPQGPSVRSRKCMVSISPTAQGTFVPQHYGTMGSFDTLMAELTRRHPHAGRQGIVDALIRLKAQHGALCGLPLSTIRDMASELLTQAQ